MSCSSFPPHLLALPPQKPTRVRREGVPRFLFILRAVGPRIELGVDIRTIIKP